MSFGLLKENSDENYKLIMSVAESDLEPLREGSPAFAGLYELTEEEYDGTLTPAQYAPFIRPFGEERLELELEGKDLTDENELGTGQLHILVSKCYEGLRVAEREKLNVAFTH